MNYRHLFSPIRINDLEIKNRIAYPSLGLLYSFDSKLNDRYYNYFEARAKGGAGLVTVGPVGVDFLGSGLLFLSLAQDEAIPAFTKAASLIKAAGARAWVQLFHAGAYTYPFMIDGQQPIAPSAVFSNYSKTTPREMTLEDIRAVQEAFVRTAERAREAGFDGVEIIGSAGYLISQFLSPLKNQRTDEYGGGFENRLRFPRELIKLARQRLGAGFPLTIRMAGNDFVPGSNTDLEAPLIARAYQEAGVDAINVTGGWHESRVPQLPMHLPRSGFAYLALNVRKAVSVPVLASNRISSPEEAERLLRDGCADLINLGRVLLADPEWPRKALEGRAEEIRPCVACSQGCTDMAFKGKAVFCVGNPRSGYEGSRKIEPAERPKKVMVVGAGLAGLEAAVTAAQRGHRVEIFEKADRIGGQIWLAARPPHKREFLEFVRYYRAMIRKLGLPVHLNTEVDLELIRLQKPDFLVIAEGAEPYLPAIEGLDDPRVLSAWQVLGDNPRLGPEVAVIGGGAVGLETALFVAAKGSLGPEGLHFLFTYEAEAIERLRELMFNGACRVSLFEMLPKIGQDVGPSTRWVLLGQLQRYGVRITTGAQVTSVAGGLVRYLKEGRQEEARFDNVILASGARPVQRLTAEAEKLGIPFVTVGDCVRPGRINDSIHGGFKAALKI